MVFVSSWRCLVLSYVYQIFVIAIGGIGTLDRSMLP